VLLLSLAVTAVAVLVALTTRCTGDERSVAPNQTTKKEQAKPIVIWFYTIHRDKPIALETALSSGLISHVMMKFTHRKDRNWKKSENAHLALALIRKYKAKLIWARSVWPYYNIADSSSEDLFDPDYYFQEIQALRAEARGQKADFVALDTEPYGYTPMKKYLRGYDKLTGRQREQLSRVIEQVTKAAGKVDFVLPAGSLASTHPYNILAGLGRYRIAENTYYNNEKNIKAIKYPYEIFGAYLNTVRENPDYPKSPFFTVRDVFEKSHLWSAKKGLFLYPKENKALEVARELAAYAKTLPQKFD